MKAAGCSPLTPPIRLLLSAEAVAQRGPVRAFSCGPGTNARRHRHPGQQRRDLDVRPDGGGRDGGVRQDVRQQRPGAAFLVGALAPGLVERGRGSIISLSSMAGGVGLAGGAAYGATKASLETMTRAGGRVPARAAYASARLPPGPVYTPTPLGRRVHHRAGGRRRRCAAHRIPRSSRSSRPPARATSPVRRSPATADVERCR
jgi:NAD(P)-dependent dehydrogenase (short-subunit alcohol dehydrogenase family)